MFKSELKKFREEAGRIGTFLHDGNFKVTPGGLTYLACIQLVEDDINSEQMEEAYSKVLTKFVTVAIEDVYKIRRRDCIVQGTSYKEQENAFPLEDE